MSKVFKDELTAVINDKGVLDLDTVKGCELGIKDNPKGCYGLCYAKKIADFRGWDFGQSITRRMKNFTHAKQLAKVIKGYKLSFVRIGTMGDPCHNWRYTIKMCQWLKGCGKIPVVITKHWIAMTTEEMREMGESGVVLNTSVSALDVQSHLDHRVMQYDKYKEFGKSVLRVVTCDFNKEMPEGKRMAGTQEALLAEDKSLDNPLRVGKSYPLVANGTIKIKQVMDINSKVFMSKWKDNIYTGNCRECKEMCGINL